MKETPHNNGPDHELHKAIGTLVDGIRIPGVELVKDSACEGKSYSGRTQRIPLFCADRKGRDVQYCNVDILALKDSEIRAIIEVEETGIKPMKICGKLLTSAVSRYYIHRGKENVPVPMAQRVLFVQVLKEPNSGDKESKEAQWQNLRLSLKDLMPIGRISEYELVYGRPAEFRSRKGADLASLLVSSLG